MPILDSIGYPPWEMGRSPREALRTPPAKWEAQSHSDAGVISTDFCAMIVHRAKFKSCYS
jgi:hypothetical protein